MVDLGEGHRGPGPPLFWVKNKKNKNKKWLKRKRPAGQLNQDRRHPPPPPPPVTNINFNKKYATVIGRL